MAFQESTFTPIGGQSSEGPAVYAYETSDTMETVLGAGYFTSKRFTLEENDFIIVAASDQIAIVTVDSSGTGTVNSRISQKSRVATISKANASEETTTVSSTVTSYKMTATTVLSTNSHPDWSMPAVNRLQWDGEDGVKVRLTYWLSTRATGGAASNVFFYTGVNGTGANPSSAEFQAAIAALDGKMAVTVVQEIEMDNGDYVELFVQNSSNTNNIATSMFIGKAEVIE